MKREETLEPRNIFKTPAHWRARAEEARTIAEGATDPTVRGLMIGIADCYDRLALHAEESDALNVKLEHAHHQLLAASRSRANWRTSEGVVFDHKMTALLSRAFNAVVAELDLRTGDDRERAAKAIIELASNRSNIDVEELRNSAERFVSMPTVGIGAALAAASSATKPLAEGHGGERP
jgi:hypothetical protein